jgi:hypothetical protein
MTRPHESPYSKVVRNTWGDGKFQRLSRLQPSGQGLWLYLLTGPHCTVIPGLFPKMGIGTLADALKWPPAQVVRAWREIEGGSMAESDWDAGVIWLPKAIQYNEPASPNVVTSWRSVPLPQCDLVTRALRSFRVYLASKENPAWVEAFTDVFRKGFPEAFAEGFAQSRSGSGSGSPPLPPLTGGRPVEIVETVEKSGDRSRPIVRVIRQDRTEARQIRSNTGYCPHHPTCESYSVCVEHIAVAIAIRRYEIRSRAN